MIELPETPAPNSVSPALIDFGMIQRPALGAKVTRIDRMGSRFRAEVGFPPMTRDRSRVFVSRLLSAKREGLRIEYPLLGVSQGVPGAPVVDGAGQAGSTLAIRGLAPHYAFREGYWLTLVDDIGDGDGACYLHNCRTNTLANADGEASIDIEPPLRAPLGDGSTILLAKPVMEGLVLGEEMNWVVPVDGLIQLAVSIEEAG